MITFLLILHGLLAVVLLGGITHQTISAVWPSRNKIGIVRSYRAVSGSVYTNANIVLYLATATLGGIIYPTYRVGVRTFLENARLMAATSWIAKSRRATCAPSWASTASRFAGVHAV